MKLLFTLLTVLSLISAEVVYADNYCRSSAEKKCLADTINGEARNQGYEGMIIVAKVVMTRLARGYKGSICALTDGSSFHRDGRRPTEGGPIDIQANKNVKDAMIEGCTFGDMNITHFYRKGSAKPNWAYDFPPANPPTHGNHYLFNAPMYVKADFEGGDWNDLIQNPIYQQDEDEDRGDGSIEL